MPLTDPQRIARQRQQPRAIELWQALQSLKSVIAFMNTGAHPDDETSQMLAALGLRDGFVLSYACANRGEGGQNDIGREITHDLGVVRTAEMERACDVLDLRMYWLSENPDDSIFDFGFSKSGVETLGKWSHSRTLKRFVEIIRLERPDIICPTFLDIPGQHGHHRAMTQAAHEVMDAAADPLFPGVSLAPWQVKKLYLPAWSGAGDAYDDDVPPPPATTIVDGDGEDPVTGWSWAQIGQQSRAFHRTQGMGRWVPHGRSNQWPLHLARTEVDSPETDITSGLPSTIADLAEYANLPELEPMLRGAQASCMAALEAFPNFGEVASAARSAVKFLRQARAACPRPAECDIRHRLEIKQRQLARVIQLASGAHVQTQLSRDIIAQGDKVQFHQTVNGPGASARLKLPDGWKIQGDEIHVPDDAQLSDAYPPIYIPNQPSAPCAILRLEADGVITETYHAFDVSPLIVPKQSVAVEPNQALLNVQSSNRKIEVALEDLLPRGADARLIAEQGWSTERTETGFEITAPDELTPGSYSLPVEIDGQPADTIKTFSYDHIALRVRTYPAQIKISVIDAKLPPVRVAYIGGGNDRVGTWLRAMGFEVSELERADFSKAGLAAFDTIVVGIFAMRTRDDLLANINLVHEWVHDGGNLVTLYHRPWDSWDPDIVPPRRLEIGKPSLRWRVTDENADVQHLLPDHVLLNVPNKIDQEDWANWHKERGLYFAKSWDQAYQPLLSMADPDEDPHLGSLLSAEIGKGRHTHTSLILHHQMEKLTPGAFRLMANLVAGGRDM